MKKDDFFEILRGLKIPFQSKLYTQLFQYFDFLCDGKIRKSDFCHRLQKLRCNSFSKTLDRFFELADPDKKGFITKFSL